MTTSQYTEYLRHHYETKPSHRRGGQPQTDRLLAPWRSHRVYNRAATPPQSR
ncbi:MAG: hypothetical protein M3313_00775 [Actinomycetota bacterium]|nr:hypothetical protein [Actinomycetota bacterium]